MTAVFKTPTYKGMERKRMREMGGLRGDEVKGVSK